MRGIIKVGVVAQFSRVGETLIADTERKGERDRPISSLKANFSFAPSHTHTHKVSDEEDSLFCCEGFSLSLAK